MPKFSPGFLCGLLGTLDLFVHASPIDSLRWGKKKGVGLRDNFYSRLSPFFLF